jgi:hypothetical protein
MAIQKPIRYRRDRNRAAIRARSRRPAQVHGGCAAPLGRAADRHHQGVGWAFRATDKAFEHVRRRDFARALTESSRDLRPAWASAKP